MTPSFPFARACFFLAAASLAPGAPPAAPGGMAALRAGGLLATVSDGQDRRGYSGLILLADAAEPRDVFVPRYCGLNLEIVQDGTAQPDSVLFETRRNPVRLRPIDDRTAELYQPPTPHWGLESWTRFSLHPGGIVEVAFECELHRSPAGGHLILSWASYIDHPASPDLYFRAATGWVRRPTPAKGIVPPWWPEDDRREFACAPGLARRFSHFFDPPEFRYVRPWMFGLCRGQMLAFIFRPEDQIHPGEAHMGGGPNCPAWDFQWPIDHPEVNRRYRMAWRMLYAPAASPADAEAAVAAHAW